MWAFTLVTLRQALRSPVPWVVGALGVFVGWSATSLAILALGVGAQGQQLTLSTSHFVATVLTLWLLGACLTQDARSGFARAGDATGPGTLGRTLGRWAGATVSATAAGSLVGLLVAALSNSATAPVTYLLITTTQIGALVGAWQLLLATRLPVQAATLAAFMLWLMGHLPWGTAPFMEGTAGLALASWLPGPRGVEEILGTLLSTGAAIGGLLLLTAATTRTVEA